MPNWLNTVTDVLDCAAKPVRIFFRDDDAGWSNERLNLLLDVFTQHAMPIDVAVIPESLQPNLAAELLSRWQQGKRLLGLHQHGYSHANHEKIGRKCEFGNGRTKNQQKDDIAKGQELLREAFGKALDPIFTPPWNRCTQDTSECLEELGFRLLSRDVTAAALESSTLKQTPVHIDWSRIIKTSPDPLHELGQAIAGNLSSNDLTGVMLHHADMDDENLKPLAELLAVFTGYNNVRGLLLRDTLG